MRRYGLDAHARNKIPELDSVVLGSTDNEVTDRVDNDLGDRKLVSTECLYYLSCRQVVQSHNFVVSPRNNMVL